MEFLLGDGRAGTSPFQQLMLVADVCANYDPRLTMAGLRSPVTADEKLVETIALYASAEGNYAYPTSGFSITIMEWLREQPVSNWWDIRLEQVANLYTALIEDGHGQQPSQVHAKTRDGERHFTPETVTERLESSDLPGELFAAYRIDPQGNGYRWKPWGTEPVPLSEHTQVRLDVLCAARRVPFRAMVVEHDGGSSFCQALERASLLPGGIRRKSAWPVLNGIQLNDLRIAAAGRLRDRLEIDGERPPRGVLLPVRDHDHDIDWSDVWPILDAAFSGVAVVVAIVAGSTLEGVHAAVSAADQAANRHISVEVYCRSVPAGPVGAVDGGLTDADSLAVIRAEITLRRSVLAARGKHARRGLVQPNILQPGIADGLVAELNADGIVPDEEMALLRAVRETLPEIWPALLDDYATARRTPGWVHGLEVAAEVRTDLTHFLRSLIGRSDHAAEDPDAVSGWLTAALIDQMSAELRKLARKGGEQTEQDSVADRVWQRWRVRTTPAVRRVIDGEPDADWSLLSVRQLVMVTRHGYPAPPPAQAVNEVVRWVTVAHSPASTGLWQLNGKVGELAAAVFDPERPDPNDPVRADHLAQLRDAIRPIV